MEADMKLAIDYHQWKEEYRSILERFCDKNLFILFSGGKDSSLAMDFMLRASQEFGFDFEAHGGLFPVHHFAGDEKERIESYWIKRGVNIIWHDLGVTDEYIEAGVDPCMQCRELKKRVLKNILIGSVDKWEKLIIVVGYNLWDIVSYSLEHILNDIFSNSGNGGTTKRFTETAQRFYPFLTMKGGYTVFRPLIKYNGGDIQKLIENAGILTLSIPCKFREFRPKRIFEKYYQKRGIRFDYDKVFNFAKRELGLPDIDTYTSIDREEYLLNIF
jgi:tRNA(Ile)-lysidine synthase TilS/MesJ